MQPLKSSLLNQSEYHKKMALIRASGLVSSSLEIAAVREFCKSEFLNNKHSSISFSFEGKYL